MNDGLVQAYVLPYVKMIAKFCPSSSFYLSTEEKKSNIQDLWPKEQFMPGFPSLRVITSVYVRLGPIKFLVQLFKLIYLTIFIYKRKIAVIHAFCSPSGMEGYILKKLTSCKLVVDSYEPHSEYMLEAGAWHKRSLAYNLLRVFENKQASDADALIVASPYVPDFYRVLHQKSLTGYYLKPACVDLEVFRRDISFRVSYRVERALGEKIVGIYAGKIGDFYLSEEVFEYVSCAVKFWGERFHFIFLSPGYEKKIIESLVEFNIPRKQVTIESPSHKSVPKYLSVADFAFSAYRPGPAKACCTPIKNGEYWSVGLPVVIPSRISVDSEIIDREGIGYVLKSLKAEEYYKSFEVISRFLSSDINLIRRKIREVARLERGYHLAESVYKAIYPAVLRSS